MSEVADANRVVEWASSQPRKPAQLAFTAGPERQAAYWIEWAESMMKARHPELSQPDKFGEQQPKIGGQTANSGSSQAGQWRIEFEYDVDPDFIFMNWYVVTDGKVSFECETRTHADWLCELLNEHASEARP